jgi:hypothetical protein
VGHPQEREAHEAAEGPQPEYAVVGNVQVEREELLDGIRLLDLQVLVAEAPAEEGLHLEGLHEVPVLDVSPDGGVICAGEEGGELVRRQEESRVRVPPQPHVQGAEDRRAEGEPLHTTFPRTGRKQEVDEGRDAAKDTYATRRLLKIRASPKTGRSAAAHE